MDGFVEVKDTCQADDCVEDNILSMNVLWWLTAIFDGRLHWNIRKVLNIIKKTFQDLLPLRSTHNLARST